MKLSNSNTNRPTPTQNIFHRKATQPSLNKTVTAIKLCPTFFTQCLNNQRPLKSNRASITRHCGRYIGYRWVPAYTTAVATLPY